MKGGPDGADELTAFEAWLRTIPGPAAGMAFRGRIRLGFLGEAAAGPAAGSRIGAPARSPADVMDADEAWLGGMRITSPAAERFRRDLRGAFLGQEAVQGPRPGPGPWRFVLVSLAAAAAIVLITFLLPENPRWEVVGMKGTGSLEVSSGELLPGETSRLTEELSRGTRLATAEQELTLSLGDVVSLRLLPHSRIQFRELPGLGAGHALLFVLESGELHFKTHSGYPGDPIRVDTSEVEVSASGTAFGVLVDERGTCTCVCDGEVIVRGREAGAAGAAGEGTPVQEGTSYLVFRGGAMAPKTMPFDATQDPAELEHTRALLEFAAAGH